MKRKVIVAGALGLLMSAGSAWSAGFALIEQSASGMGNAFAGGSAVAEDASTIYFNPAGLTRLASGHHLAVAAHYIAPSAKFSDDGSRPLIPGLGLGTEEGGDAGEAAVVPNLYYAWVMENGFALGLGINVPFGLATEYPDDWIGRYHAVRSEVQTININPSIAYRVNERFSVGFGVSAQQVKAELSKAIDFGSAAYSLSGGAMGTPQGQDGDVVLEADDWTYGWNAGLLYEVNEGTRIGFAYRSGVSYEAEGDADFTVPASVSGLPVLGAQIAAVYADTEASADIDLPATASLSAYHQINDRLALMADITWTQWSDFEELRVEFEQNAYGQTPSDSVTTENWKDNMRYSVGATYRVNDQLQLRGGLAYDETPVPDSHRTPRIPGNDRLWTAVGLGYQASEHLGIDFGYAHLFVADADINQVDNGANENKLAGTLSGSYENKVDIASIQLNYHF